MKKTIILIIASILVLSSIGCTYTKNDEQQKISSMLKEFYMAYNTVWQDSEFEDLVVRLDSLQQKYCSLKFRTELKKAFEVHGLDHDVLTNDYGTDDEAMKTLLVTKDSTRVNVYTVSYLIDTDDPANKRINQKVQIHIVVVEEDGTFKIDNVLDD